MLFLHGHILEALALNPNVLFAIAFLILTLPMLLYDVIAQKPFTMRAYEACERALKNKWVLILFCLFEAAIWIHNIVCHV